MRTLLLCASLLLPSLAPAVMRSVDGSGQVLILPYYRVQSSPRNDNLQALVTVANQSDQTKALKLRFREAVNGREVLALNLYLGPRDSWTGALAALTSDGAAQLFTADKSCTVPAISQQQLSGFRSLEFSLADYTGPRADGGPQNASRTQEGYVEILEMGSFQPGSATDLLLRLPAAQRQCAPLLQNWSTGGKWDLDPQADLAPPGGDLAGNLALVDVARTSVFQIPAVALEAFSIVAQHSGPLAALPDLSSPVTDPERRFVTSTVLLDGRVVRSEWPVERAIDAVSAVLAVESVTADYSLDPHIQARADWILSLPTKRHYTDAALATMVQAPFDGTAAPLRCSHGIDGRSYDRNGEFISVDYSPPPPPSRLCRSVELLTLGFTQSSILPPGPRVPLYYASFADAGHLAIGFPGIGYQRTQHLSRPARGGERYAGLPVLAVRLQQYVNHAALPGIAGYFGLAQELPGSAHCFQTVEPIANLEFRTTPCVGD